MNFDSSTLLVSLLWSSIGSGMLIYGKKQQSIPAVVGGLGLLAISYFIEDAMLMTIAAVVIIAGTWWLVRRG